MNRMILLATAFAATVTLATPAKADRLLLQMLGEAQDIGGLEDANLLVGTNIDEDDVFEEAGIVLPPANDFLGCHQVALVDMATKVQMGSGIDCLYGVTGGVAAVSYFILPGGSFVSAGLTSLGTFTVGVGDNPVVPGDAGSPSPVLMTGSIPDLTSNTIVAGTGQFANAKGTGRVSGAVFPGPLVDGSNFWFNCMWEFNLERQGKKKGRNRK